MSSSDDRERLSRFRAALDSVDGLDEGTFRRLSTELQRRTERVGYDSEGRLKIAFFSSRSYETDSFRKLNNERFGLTFLEASLSMETAAASDGFKAICIFVNDECNRDVVEALAGHGVEMILLRCAGFNNVDLKACEEQNISVARVPAYSPYAVAEHTVALMLMLNRRLHRAYQRIRAGRFALDGLTGFDMRGKTVGIVGTGKIGQVACGILNGFGCRILAYDKFPNSQLMESKIAEYVELDELVAQSDIISLHIPLFPETHHLINRESIQRMKRGVMLLNTSRGGLVDTRALIEGLKTGHIGSAGLDVYEEEAGIFFEDLSNEVLTDDVLARLLTFNNVVITSHQAFLTQEALANIAETTLENAAEFLQGRAGRELTNGVHAE